MSQSATRLCRFSRPEKEPLLEGVLPASTGSYGLVDVWRNQALLEDWLGAKQQQLQFLLRQENHRSHYVVELLHRETLE